MKKNLRRAIIVSLGVLLFAAGLPAIQSLPSAEAAAGKVTICHRTRSATNPYRLITVSQNAAVRNNGHKVHTGGVFVTTANYYTGGGGGSNAKDWGDIIPGADSDGTAYNGANNIAVNWDVDGKKFFPGGVNASYCGKMTAQQFYDIQIAAGETAANIVADLNDQDANEDKATLSALPGGVFTTSNVTTADSVSGVTTNAATSVTGTTATLNGSVKAGTVGIKWKFEWGTSSTLSSGTTITTLSSTAVTSTTAAQTTGLTGLTPGTTYYFRIIGVTNAGDVDLEATINGSILDFTTPPTATTVAASSITATGATLNGTIKDGATGTSWKFEWGTDSGLASGTTITSLSGSAASPATASVNTAITGLTGGTTYYFRVIGVKGGTTVTGSILNFVASASAPTVQGIDFPNIANKVYGNVPFSIQATSKTPDSSGTATGLTVTFTSQTPAVCTVGSSSISSNVSSASVTIVTIGTCTIRASQPGGVSGGTNYSAAADVDKGLTITKAPLTVTADNKSKTEGASDPTFTSVLSGTLYYGDSVTISGVTHLRVSGETAGTYAITPAAGTLSNGNYEVTLYSDGTLTISAAPANNSGSGGKSSPAPKAPPKAAPIKNTVVVPGKTPHSNSPATPNTPANPNTPPVTNPTTPVTPSAPPINTPEIKSTPKVDPLPTAQVPIVDGDNNPIPLKDAEIKKGPVKADVDEEGKLKLIVPIGYKGKVEIEITPKPENPGDETEKQKIEIPVQGPKPPVEPEAKKIPAPRLLPNAPGVVNVVGLKDAVNVSWKPDPKAQAYEIYAEKQLVCTTVYASCSIPSENGVKKNFEVVTVTSTGTKPVGTSSGAALAKGTLLAIVYFATDKDVLTAKSKATLTKLSNDLLALGLRDVSLSGHTDTQASGTYNQALSSRRSNKVEAFLDNKVLNAVIDKGWSGETQLAIPTPDEVNAAKNRRVEIRVR